ncbi:hypothetical protein [Sphingobium estronivorans]|uniref:hypothetical protein n=1 Tax=Sphingobium estronivorans TaxID=1577690 RepID=UPI00123C36DD|nr:hypothetical protein [Sphingobium estronivorans]
MSDLDRLLDQLRGLPTDPRLMDMEAAVMAGVAKRGERAVAWRSLALAGIVAIGTGWIGGIGPGSRPVQAVSRPAVIGMSDYAPSRLLEQ